VDAGGGERCAITCWHVTCLRSGSHRSAPLGQQVLVVHQAGRGRHGAAHRRRDATTLQQGRGRRGDTRSLPALRRCDGLLRVGNWCGRARRVAAWTAADFRHTTRAVDPPCQVPLPSRSRRVIRSQSCVSSVPRQGHLSWSAAEDLCSRAWVKEGDWVPPPSNGWCVGLLGSSCRVRRHRLVDSVGRAAARCSNPRRKSALPLVASGV
jgi:hypothetical protein